MSLYALEAFLTGVTDALERQNREWDRIIAREKERLLGSVDEQIDTFGPHLMESWDPEDSPTFPVQLEQSIRLVYIGHLDRYTHGSETEPEQLFNELMHRSVYYLGEDGNIYAYEPQRVRDSIVVEMRRLNLRQLDWHLLRYINRLLMQTGLY